MVDRQMGAPTSQLCTTELWDALKSFILNSLKIKVAPYHNSVADRRWSVGPSRNAGDAEITWCSIIKRIDTETSCVVILV